MISPPQKYLIALADDDMDDREIFCEVCSNLDIALEVLLFENGHELLHYLHGPAAAIPNILFLDINMPVKNGFEALSAIRSKEDFDSMCIIMYSTSVVRSDVNKARVLGANLFFQKPYDFRKFSSTIRKILDTDWKDPCEQIEEKNFLIST